MPDPLIEQYNLSLQSGQAGRDRLADSKLKKASESIQRTGKPYGPTRPAVAAVRFTDIKDPPEGGLAKLPPSSISDQFATLQQQQLQNLAAAAKAQYYAPDNAIPPGTAPTGIVQQFNELKRQQGERWKKIVDELWRLEQAEYNILWQLYQAMVRDEYAQLARPKATWSAAFNEFKERGGLELYFNLRPIYYRANIKEPHKLIMQMVSGVTLAGVEVLQGVHPTFAKILERVDRSINRSTFPQFGIQPVKYIGCFRPEPLGDRISNHMIGAAIDIDATIKKADRNPHLKEPQLDALNEMLKLRAKTQPPLIPGGLSASGSWLAGVPNLDSVDRARALHAQTLAISKEAKAFLDDWLDTWVALQKKPQSLGPGPKKDAVEVMNKLAKAFGGEKGLRNIQSGGIISIPLEVFEALTSDPDLQSGTQYDVNKDIMHFEVKRASIIIGSGGDL